MVGTEFIAVQTDHALLTAHLLSAITVLALFVQLALLLLCVGKKGDALCVGRPLSTKFRRRPTDNHVNC